MAVKTKFPIEYTKTPELVQPGFKPDFIFDSHGNLIMPFTREHLISLKTTPGSKDVKISTDPVLSDPASIKSGYLNLSTYLKVGPKDGWVVQLAGGDFPYPISYYNEKTNAMNFYVDKDGNVYLKGKITAGTGSQVDWSYIQNVQVVNAQIVSLSADKLTAGTIDAGVINVINLNAGNITTGTLTGRTVQTGFPTGTNKVIRLSSVDTHLMEFMYGEDVIGKLEVIYNEFNDFAGFSLEGGGGTYLSGSGKSNMGIVQMGLANKYFGLAWTANDPDTERIITNARIDSPLLPYTSGYNLGDPDYKWQNIYLSGNIYVDGAVDGVDISAHASNPSAHHTKTAYSSEISVNSNWSMNNYEINNLSYLRFSSSYGEIYWGTKRSVKMRNPYDPYPAFDDQGWHRWDMRVDMLPWNDHWGQIGNDDRRWWRVRAVLCESGDFVFENKFRITEEGDNALAIYNQRNEKILIIDEEGNINKVKT